MHVEITPRQFSIRVYDDHNDTNYVASAQLFSYGDRCFLYAIHGKDFYKATIEILHALEEMGIKQIDGYASPAHARLCRMMLKKAGVSWTVEEDGAGKMFGHDLIWMRLKNVKS